MALARGNGGALYAAGWEGDFYNVNTNTGAFALVGNMGFGNIMDMATRVNGTVIGTDSYGVYEINTLTAASTLLSNLSINGSPMGLAFDSSDNLYATTYEGNSVSTR